MSNLRFRACLSNFERCYGWISIKVFSKFDIYRITCNLHNLKINNNFKSYGHLKFRFQSYPKFRSLYCRNLRLCKARKYSLDKWSFLGNPSWILINYMIVDKKHTFIVCGMATRFQVQCLFTYVIFNNKR